MEQNIRFCELDGKRIAYATVGEGPLLVFGAKWVSHLEEEWDDARARSFYEDLAQGHRVVRYDRMGAGLSDRSLSAPASTDLDTRTLRSVIEASGGPSPTVAYAMRRPSSSQKRMACSITRHCAWPDRAMSTRWPAAARRGRIRTGTMGACTRATSTA